MAVGAPHLSFPDTVMSKRTQSANKYFSDSCVPGAPEAAVSREDSAVSTQLAFCSGRWVICVGKHARP